MSQLQPCEKYVLWGRERYQPGDETSMQILDRRYDCQVVQIFQGGRLMVELDNGAHVFAWPEDLGGKRLQDSLGD